MKKICHSNSDIIGGLPDVILENILNRVPLRDAVRTSLLSKNWRRNWWLISQLVFDDSLLTILPEQDKLITRHRLLLVISQVLLPHPTPVLKFTLSIRELECCPELDKLIIFLTSNGVEELTLQIWKGEFYKLPSSLYSCGKLTHLSLRCCIFGPSNTFEGFTRVCCLELSEVIVSRGSFARLISSCPLLEQLKFRSVAIYDSLDIDSHSLKRSYFTGNFRSICFKNAPCLAIVSLLSKVPASRVMPDNGDSFGWREFFTNLPVLENLEMDEYYVKSLAGSSIAASQVPTQWTLRILKLHGVCLDFHREICVPLCLMKSPKLQKVTVEVNSSTERYVEALKDLQNFGTLVFNQIREVELGITSGTAVELEFIKLLLVKLKVLEKMVVKPDPGKVRDGGLKILKELTKFKRLSPKAKVTYEDPDLTEVGGRKF